MGRVLLLCGAYALTACTAVGIRALKPDTTASLPAAAQPTDDLPGLLRYAEQIRVLPPAQQQKTLAASEQRARTNPTPFEQVRLALLLGQLGTPVADEPRARALLQSVIRARGRLRQHDELASFARFVLATLDDRARLRKRTEQSERELAAEHKARTKLQQQLDQLKAIEQKLNDREKTDEAPAR